MKLLRETIRKLLLERAAMESTWKRTAVLSLEKLGADSIQVVGPTVTASGTQDQQLQVHFSFNGADWVLEFEGRTIYLFEKGPGSIRGTTTWNFAGQYDAPEDVQTNRELEGWLYNELKEDLG